VEPSDIGAQAFDCLMTSLATLFRHNYSLPLWSATNLSARCSLAAVPTQPAWLILKTCIAPAQHSKHV